ncbi:MAG: recombinase [Candidatus Omnitrophica bacterium]|nr:recombinase [Candidatus Omnitrophota bacterium]
MPHNGKEKKNSPTVVLHVCCGVCLFSPVQRLREQKYHVTGLFCNPNIHPLQEYERRYAAASLMAEKISLPLIKTREDRRTWRSLCEPYANDPEGGTRCGMCYHVRLRAAYAHMLTGGYDFFTTTLTVSPHKGSERVFEAGQRIGGERFLKIDFKKQNGFKKTMDAAREYALYRQNYCGCEYSKTA